MNNILVTGANGQLGSELRVLAEHYPHYNFYFTDIYELDITNKNALQLYVSENRVDTIINCAAYTAVDKAESEFQLADNINHIAVHYLAEVAKLNHCKFIHVSTDYVFDGVSSKPYVETDAPNPKSVYGSTKLAGEKAIQKVNPLNTIIIRTSWVYSSFGSNFVKTILRLGKADKKLNVVVDQIGTPTYAGDLAKAILEILPKVNNNSVELFHYSNEGVCSWYDFSKTILDASEIKKKVHAVDSSQFPTQAERPFYSVLNKNKIKKTYNLDIPYWKDSLLVCLNKLK